MMMRTRPAAALTRRRVRCRRTAAKDCHMSRSMSSGMMPTAMLSRTGGTSLAAPQASTLPSSLSGPGVGGEAVNVGAARVAAERPSWQEVLRAVAVVVASSAQGEMHQNASAKTTASQGRPLSTGRHDAACAMGKRSLPEKRFMRAPMLSCLGSGAASASWGAAAGLSVVVVATALCSFPQLV